MNPLRDISLGMGIGDLSEDPRYASPQAQLARRDEINALLTEHFHEKTTDEWMEQLASAGVLCARIRTLDQAVEDPQTQANHMVVSLDFPDAGEINVLGTPMRLYDTPAAYDSMPPHLGAHTSELLGELGYDQEQIDDLLARGIVEENHAW